MALLDRVDQLCATPKSKPQKASEDNFAINELDAELERLTAANQQLLSQFTQADGEPAASSEGELEKLRQENADLRVRIEELEALGAGKGEELWKERQREYEMLLEEKSEVIRDLHHKMQELQEAQESAIGGDGGESAQASSVSCSGNRLGQAAEIIRLKREMDDQRRQLEQDEADMMAQMRTMEMTMAKERAEMARQRQEVQRLQAALSREAENSARDPELKERLNNLRRPASSAEHPTKETQQKSSGFFRRIFG